MKQYEVALDFFEATSEIECETLCTESPASSSAKTSGVSFDEDAGKPTSSCCGTSEIASQCDEV